MILFAFSMPLPTPNIRISIQATSASICHILLPNADAILPNAAPNSSTFSGESVAPVNVPTAYLRIHPITTVYPIAMASDPNTGIIPSASPTFLFPFFSQAIPNASIGPAFAARPKLISPITPVEPISITNIKYGIRNEPPPYNDTLVGNIQIFPIPTAEPIQAQINPHLLLNDSLLFIIFPLQPLGTGFFGLFTVPAGSKYSIHMVDFSILA